MQEGTCCQELVDLNLAAVCKIAKLRLPHCQDSALSRKHRTCHASTQMCISGNSADTPKQVAPA
jgi:hypothetical protein